MKKDLGWTLLTAITIIMCVGAIVTAGSIVITLLITLAIGLITGEIK